MIHAAGRYICSVISVASVWDILDDLTLDGRGEGVKGLRGSRSSTNLTNKKNINKQLKMFSFL